MGPDTFSGGVLMKTPPYFVLVRFERGAYRHGDVNIRVFQSGERGAVGGLGWGDGALSIRISRSVPVVANVRVRRVRAETCVSCCWLMV